MATDHDVIIIGGGHNGLVTAFYLAKSGLKPLVLERRDKVGGAAVTEEFHPGFRCSTLAHIAGPLLPSVMRDLRLERHGLRLLRSDVQVFAPSRDGRPLLLYDDHGRSSQSIAGFSTEDARRYPQLLGSLGRIGELLRPFLSMTPPSLDSPSAGDMWELAKAGRRFRRLGKTHSHRLLRWIPMPAADLASEWFESDPLRAVVCARGILGAFAGPRSAGTAAGVLFQARLDGRPFAPALFTGGGLGALTEAIADAARGAGAEITTGAEVARINVSDAAVSGVVLASGHEIRARAVVSNADPKRTFLKLIDPIDLDPDFLKKIQNYRTRGTSAKVNLALDGLPDFSALKSLDETSRALALSGRIHIGPDVDSLERAFDAAKYGDFSSDLYLDATIPSLLDPPLAPAGRQVMSVYVQYAPYALKRGDWNSRRDELGEAVVRTLATFAPDLPSRVLHRQVITPLDLERVYGLTEGHIFHGEHALDQIFTGRPVLGWAQYRTPIRGLYLCGAGTHPGGGVTGAPGANASREILRDLRRRR